jgi:hypothetical protein
MEETGCEHLPPTPYHLRIIDGKPSSEGDIVLVHVTELAPGQPSAKRPTPEAAGIAYPQYFGDLLHSHLQVKNRHR